MTFNIRQIKSENIISDSIFGSLGTDTKVDIDSILLTQYINSQEMFDTLDLKFNLIDFLNSERTDILDRFSLKYKEDYLDLYRKSISLSEIGSGVHTLSFVFYDQKLTTQILDEIEKLSQNFINNLEDKRNSMYVSEMEKETLLRKKDLENSKNAIKSFQLKNKIIDPKLMFSFDNELLSELTIRKLDKRAELDVQGNFIKKKTIQVLTLESEIININEELDKLKAKLYNNETYINQIIEFEELTQDLTFKFDLYKSSLLAHELNLMDNKKSSKYFEVITSSTKPDKHKYPDKFNMILITLIISLVLYFIMLFMVKIIEEHK